MHRGPAFPKEVVAPEGLDVLNSNSNHSAQTDAPERDRRVAFAKWLIDPKNPLTARVMVNRIWHYHFGRGLVATPSDFGDMGFRPTHPDLLDWLAFEFMANGWSVKHMHRLILRSKTYRQASLPRRTVCQVRGRALWRFPPRRLEAEAIANALLLAGALDRKMYGPGFLLFVPNSNYARNWIAKDEFELKDTRRMVYTMIRMEQDSVFGAFDCPDGGQAAPNRSRSTTPIQALNLYNSAFMGIFPNASPNALPSAGDDPEKQIERAYGWTFGRSPQKEETKTPAYLNEHGLPALCRVLSTPTNSFSCTSSNQPENLSPPELLSIGATSRAAREPPSVAWLWPACLPVICWETRSGLRSTPTGPFRFADPFPPCTSRCSSSTARERSAT